MSLDEIASFLKEQIKIEKQIVKSLDETSAESRIPPLKKFLKVIIRGETITAEEWLDMMWRSVPFHGAPGG